MTTTLSEMSPRKRPEPSTEELAAVELVRHWPGAGSVLDPPGWAVEAVHQDGAGDGAERGDDRPHPVGMFRALASPRLAIRSRPRDRVTAEEFGDRARHRFGLLDVEQMADTVDRALFDLVDRRP